MCKAFVDIAPEESEKIIKDNTMCPFCLLHSTEDVCHVKMVNTKFSFLVPECNKEHIQWLHEILMLGKGNQ
jgi:hypothetical protein